jgi:hypothetical protein
MLRILSIDLAYIISDEDWLDRGRSFSLKNANVGADGLWTVTRCGQPPRDAVLIAIAAQMRG